MPLGADVVAAGAVVTRRGGREVLLVHRPKYDDWSFPKGKQDAGEHIVATAVREVLEETGLRIELGRPLRPQYYEISAGRSKVVNYWVARSRRDVDDGPDAIQQFEPTAEIDAVKWLSLPGARARLTYLDDIELLDQLLEAPKRTAPLIIVRHALARERATWAPTDALRPLSRAGRGAAAAMVPILDAYDVRRLVSSPSRRCLETAAPYAEAAGLKIEEEYAISEEGSDAARQAGLFAELLDSTDPTAVFSHRPVLPGLFGLLGVEEEPLAPGEIVVCHHRKGRVVAVERHQTPQKRTHVG